MGKFVQAVSGTKQFMAEVQAEMKKSSWPTRSELVESTVVIIISVCLLSAFVGVSDLVLETIVRLVIRAG